MDTNTNEMTQRQRIYVKKKRNTRKEKPTTEKEKQERKPMSGLQIDR